MAKCFNIICPCCGKIIKLKGKNVIEDVFAFNDIHKKEGQKEDVKKVADKLNIEFGSLKSGGA